MLSITSVSPPLKQPDTGLNTAILTSFIEVKRSPPVYDRAQKTDKNQNDRYIYMPI
jgi:hypothetical protein